MEDSLQKRQLRMETTQVITGCILKEKAMGFFKKL